MRFSHFYNLFLLLFCLFTIAACSKSTPVELTRNLDYGPYPENYKEIVESYMEDMDNLYKYTIISEEPFRDYAKTMDYDEDLPKYGWLVTVQAVVKFYDYPLIGKERHVTKKGVVYYTNVYGSEKTFQGYKTEVYNLYIRNGFVVGEERTARSALHKDVD